jgi:hypothetical protein
MNMRARQRGMTMWGASFVIAVFVFSLFILFKLFPPYMESFTIRDGLNGAAPGATSKEALINKLAQRFSVEDVKSIRLLHDLKIERRGRLSVAIIQYEVVVPLFYNVSVLLDFHFEREMAAVE